MTNSLIKNNVTDTVDETVWVPAVPYVAPTPARTVSEMRTVCAFRYTVPGTYSYVSDPVTGELVALFIPADPNYSGLTGTYSCQPQLVPVFYPATPGQAYEPGYYTTEMNYVPGYNLGWNSGARSIGFITADGSVEFKGRTSIVGVIAGMNVDDGTVVDYNGNTIDYGFMLARGVARIIENGVLKASVGAYTETTIFKITRTGTGISYKLNGVEVGTATGAGTGATWLEAAMYSAPDEIFDPVLTQTSAPSAVAGTGTLAITLEALDLLGSEGPYGVLSGALEFVDMASSAPLTEPAYGILSITLSPADFFVTGLTGEIGQLAASLTPMDILSADHPYGEMFFDLPALYFGASAYEGNLNASMSSSLAGASTMETMNFLAVTFTSAGAISTTMVVNTVVDGEMLSEAAAGSTLAANGIYAAVMLSLARSGSVLGVPEDGNETWVFNLDSKGSTSYSNYAFNSFALIGGKYYGASTSGIVELDGDTDGGAPIRARISFGKLDFDTAEKKTVNECYVGMSAAGNLFVKVIAEGAEHIYQTRDFSLDLQQQRVTFGKGLRTNYVELELYNEDGVDFELSTVRFQIADLTRRI